MMNGTALKRWSILFIVALVMMSGYVFWDIVSPVSTMLKASLHEGGMAWTSAEYGFYAGSYSVFNIFFLMLFFGGVILDKCGIRITGLMATGAMLVGALVNYYAITVIDFSNPVIHSFSLGGIIPSPIKLQVLFASLGFGLFGVGCDITGITVSKIITKWFTGYELASAMGMQVAMARLGTASALSLSPLLASAFGIPSLLLFGACVLAFGFVLFVFYCFLERNFCVSSREIEEKKGDGYLRKEQDESGFRLLDFLNVIRNPGFVLIVLLCVFYYSSIRPFMKFATDVMINIYGFCGTDAGWIVSSIPYGAIVLSPLFGMLYDRKGRGALLLLVGCLMLAVGHLGLAFPFSYSPAYSLVVMLFEGVAFSLVPAALWPSIPKLVPLAQLGTAYSVTYYIQNIGLMLVPLWVGHVVDANTDVWGKVDYTQPMLIFICLGIVAVVISMLLDRKYHYGLDDKNIRRDEV